MAVFRSLKWPNFEKFIYPSGHTDVCPMGSHSTRENNFSLLRRFNTLIYRLRPWKLAILEVVQFFSLALENTAY